MSSPETRSFVELMWEKDPHVAQRLRRSMRRMSRHRRGELWKERECEVLMRLRGKKWVMPSLNVCDADELLLMCYAELQNARKRRGEMTEMLVLTMALRGGAALVRAIAASGKSPQAAMDAAKLDAEFLDESYGLLHQVQRQTNPMATPPHGESVDQLLADYERLRGFFDSPEGIQVSAVD